MRKVLIVVFVAGLFSTLFGTDSRVLTMGRYDAYFMDDVSIFRNPANVSIYPNMLMGSLGIYREEDELDKEGYYINSVTGDTVYADTRYNRDPQKPFFGGILSYSLNQSADAGDQYPMLSMGVVLNRYDEMLDFITPSSNRYVGFEDESTYPDVHYVDPVGKMDFIMGVALKNGAMIGGGVYVAFQKIKVDEDVEEETRLIRGNGGVNLPVGKTMDLEVSMSGGVMTKIGKDGANVLHTVADNDIFLSSDVRLFSALSSLNGDFVPNLGFKFANFNGGNNRLFSLNAGFAVNVNIDRGFFWAGCEGFYENNSAHRLENFSSVDQMGGRISFGLERNIIWDWFVWRIGGTKVLGFKKVGKGANAYTKWFENPEADASDADHVATGWGLNIENRFKVDCVLSEDIFYTFTNLISGNHHHITARITATYSF